MKTLKTLPSSITIPSFIKNSAKILQFFSPKLATLYASKLFRTPVKFSVPKREKMMWESAQKKRIKVEELDKEIDILSYGYSQKKVLLVHGWAGRSTQLFMIADKLLEKGFMTISFDATAHGKSDGKESSLPEFIACIQQINKEFGPFTSAVGHSLGGMALYNTANELNLTNFATIGAANKITIIVNRFVENMSLKPKIAKKVKDYYDKKFNNDIDILSSEKHTKDIKMPVLVVHDSLDGDVSVRCAFHIRQNLEKGTLLITEGLGHTKILRDKNTVNRIASFIKENL